MSYHDLDRAVLQSRPSPRAPRLRQASPSPVVSLSPEHISDAFQKSPDHGATLELAHRQIADVSETMAEELVALGRNKSLDDRSAPLTRLALGHNRLTTLPLAFSLLSHLRYLNLKSNSFTIFPDVLTSIPSLEVLDLSRNKISCLPAQAGSLQNLQVFSLSNNKIFRLPSYIVDFRQLRIFKMDQNPVDWPPKSIMEFEWDSKDSRSMEDWIKMVQTWIQDHSPPNREQSEESMSNEIRHEIRMQAPSVASYFSTDEPFLSIHSRSVSVESDKSTYSAIEASLRFSGISSITTSKSPKSDRPPRLNLSPFSGFNNRISPSRSPSSSPIHYLPTPDDSVSSAEEDTANASAQLPAQQHIRNASYAGVNPKRPPLFSKQSLPDLRLSKPPIIQRGNSGRQYQSYNSSPVDKTSGRSENSPSRKDSGFSEGLSSSGTATISGVPSANSPTVMDTPVTAPSIDIERNCYFRRLSTLPSSTISKSIPQSLLSLVDAARGILFAVSQVYQTLQHYTVYAIDERLSAVLLKVLDPASNYMIHLINALDRFDATCRRTLPSPMICRTVVESCRDTVAVFGKAMGVLALQLKVLATRDDARYTRQMLLVLYGATAEISNAWHIIMPHIDEVEPLLRERPPPASTKHQHTPSASLRIHASVQKSSTTTIPPIPAVPPVPSVPSVPSPRPLWRSHSAQPPVENDRTRMMRRHAGSFSSKDVQIGKMLPSYVDPPISESPSRTQTPRLTMRQQSNTSSSASPLPNGLGSATRRSWGNHSRQDSQSSVQPSSSNSSASSSPSVPSVPSRPEMPSNSSTLLDNDAIDAMQVAVDVAPSVWDVMDTIVEDVQGTQKINLLESLASAKVLTQRLKTNIRAVKSADPTADRKRLRDDATAFAKTVIALCNVFKTHGLAHPLPSALRANMIALTNATEESVMLLHVSSFSPSSVRSPVVTVFSTSLLNPDDGKLGANLTRSKSALPTTTVPAIVPPRTSSIAYSELQALSSATERH